MRDALWYVDPLDILKEWCNSLILKCQYLQYDRNNKACHRLKLRGNTLNMTFKSTRNTVTQISFMSPARSHFEDHSPREHTQGAKPPLCRALLVEPSLLSPASLTCAEKGFKAFCFCCHLRACTSQVEIFQERGLWTSSPSMKIETKPQ